MRSELTIAGECMAAFQVALCKRILAFGFDESTKWGLGLLSTNAQIERRDGTVVVVVLRGATLTAGGTAQQITKEINEQIFAHAKTLIIGWRAAHEAKFCAGSWAAAGGPDPESIGIHRLAEQSLLMSDTCNAARATKQLVAELAEAAMKEKIGEERWRGWR